MIAIAQGITQAGPPPAIKQLMQAQVPSPSPVAPVSEAAPASKTIGIATWFIFLIMFWGVSNLIVGNDWYAVLASDWIAPAIYPP